MDPFSLDHIINFLITKYVKEQLSNDFFKPLNDMNIRLSTPMDQRRVELLTPALSERCSNQLSYWSSKKTLGKRDLLQHGAVPIGTAGVTR